MSVQYVPHQKEKLAQYIRRTYSQWQIVLIRVVSSTEMTYTNVVSVTAEKHNIHIHASPLIPYVATMHLTLRGQRCIRYKNVFTSYRCGDKTFPGLFPPWVRGRD
jgi:hypothetical protein